MGMLKTVAQAWKVPEIRSKMIFTLLMLVVFRIGSNIPVPNINRSVLSEMFTGDAGLFDLFDLFSGGSFSNFTIFALSITPYITASIIVQLLTIAFPYFENLAKEGMEGRKKMAQITRYMTVVLALIQAIGLTVGLFRQAVVDKSAFSVIVVVLVLTAGTAFLMWLGEQITERGIGNGISIIIFAGIVAGLPPAIAHTIEQARQGDLHFLLLLLVAVLVFAVTFFVVFVERGQRRIVVNYAKRQQGRRVYAAQSTHLPLKVNMAGVIPAIFASSIILFPATIASWFGGGTGWNWLTTISLYLQPGQPLYVLLYASAIIFFCFFYTALVFNPRETADNLKKSGAFVPGIRPGEQTAKYIDKVMTRLTLVGALYITFICLIPEFMRDAMKVPFYFGGTSLLIVVVVIMDFMAQVQTLMMSSQYESALKKANLKGYGR